MKNLVFLVFILALVSCQQGKIDRMKVSQDSLASLAAQKDSAILDFVSAMSDIQENLDSIKKMEDIVRIQSTDVSEGKTSDKDHIVSDIQLIHELMQRNKELINKLQKQLGSSNAKVAELQRAIVILNRQVEQKDADIAALTAELEKLNLDMAGLNTRMDQMSAESMHKDQVIREKTSTIESQTAAINQAYYAFGTQKELIENDLVEKKGGFLGLGRNLKMKEDFNKSYFTEVDIRQLTTLELHVKKASLVTIHPANSYHFEGNDLIEALVIDKPQEFWKTSKYLIIVVN